MTAPKWLGAISWVRILEFAIGACLAGSALLGFAYTLGADRTNIGRDVETNRTEIQRNRGDIDQHTRAIEANRKEMESQRNILTRIEEGVKWIKEDLQEAGK